MLEPTNNAEMSVDHLDVPWMLKQWVDKQPDKTCLIFCPFDGAEQRVTYAELLAGSQRLAEGLSLRGVKPGNFVLLHMDNSPEFIFSWYACAVLGAVAVSTNTRSVSRDLRYFAEVTEAVCCLTQPKFAEMIRNACPDLSFLAVTNNDAGPPRTDSGAIIEETAALPFEELFADDRRALAPPNPQKNLSVQFTSGTTSRPKAVLWTHANGVWAGMTTARHFGLRQDDVTIIYMPLFHTNAQAYSMLSTHWSGGTIVVQPKFSASRFWKTCVKHKATWASMIPFTIKAIMSQPVPEHTMRFWSIGAHLPDIGKQFGVDTLGLWGMTETLTQGIMVDLDNLGPALTMGKPAPEYEVQIRREDGSVCDRGEAGQLFIRGERGVSLFEEYYRNPEANASAFDEDGWFDTGDIIRSDDDGWLYFCDRKKDMLKVGVENVAASEIETVVMQTGLVSECAVVGQPHYMLDEVPVAFVISSDQAAAFNESQLEKKIIDHCRLNLPDFKVVRSVHVVRELPRSTLEKVAKKMLRDQLEPITSD